MFNVSYNDNLAIHLPKFYYEKTGLLPCLYHFEFPKSESYDVDVIDGLADEETISIKGVIITKEIVNNFFNKLIQFLESKGFEIESIDNWMGRPFEVIFRTKVGTNPLDCNYSSDIYIHIERRPYPVRLVATFMLPNSSLASNEVFQYLINDMYSLWDSNIVEYPTKQSYVKVIASDGSSLYVEEIPFIPNTDELDIESHYNDDFLPKYKHIITTLNKPNSKGLYILHGKAGTGKTTFLQHLIKTINKPVVFMPAQLVDILNNPSHISFLKKLRNNVIIIEEAESIVNSNGQRTTNISALLNHTDGILSQVLNIPIIITFNSDIRNIDSALLRKGRLVEKYEFKNLTPEKSVKLATKLGVVLNNPTEEHTLADIYNQQQESHESVKSRIGFTS